MRFGTGTRLYATSIRHARTAPVRHAFAHRSYSWLVDLDDLPRLGILAPLASFEARDHVGDPDRTLRENLDAFLRSHGIDLDGGRITMLANARVLGYVFNPIAIFWCHRPDDTVACVVVEVHNTYGQRHAYLVHPDAEGHTTTTKELYVSPFNDVSGWYDFRLAEPGRRLHVAVTLHRAGHPPFVAAVVGHVVPATVRSLLRLAAAHPLEPLAVTARIRWHGVRLWARRLPVQPRPVVRQEALR